MSDKGVLAKMFPKNRNDRKTLWTMGGYLALMVIFVEAALIFQHRRLEEIRNTWQSTTATIEECSARRCFPG
jgi:hypothetical protein